MAQDPGPLAPIAVAGIVILILVLNQPLSGEMGGIPLNWVAVATVAVGGLLGALQGPQ
jgi:hypothetical protein